MGGREVCRKDREWGEDRCVGRLGMGRSVWGEEEDGEVMGVCGEEEDGNE